MYTELSCTLPRCTPSFGRYAPFGKNFAAGVAVVARIGVDDAADGAVFRTNLRLDAAPGVAVARNNDRAFHGNAAAIEHFVIFGQTVIHVDQRRSHVAVNRIGVVGGQLLRRLIRSGIFGNDWLLQLGGEMRDRHRRVQRGVLSALEIGR